MDIILYTANAVFPLFIIIGVGYALRVFGLMDESLSVRVNKVCFTIMIPANLFKTIYQAKLSTDAVFMVGYVVAIYTFVIIPVLCFVIPRLGFDRMRSGAIIQGSFRSNSVLLGVPLMTNLYGAENITPMALIVTFLSPLYAIAGTVVLTFFAPDRENRKLDVGKMFFKILTNPLIVGAIIGFIFNFGKLTLPTILQKPVFDLASMASPLALLALGARFSFESLSSNRRGIAIAATNRLLIIPFIVVTCAAALGFRDVELAAMFVATAAPTAIASVAMADSMGSDGKLAGEITVVTSLLSCVTLFLGLCLLQVLRLI